MRLQTNHGSHMMNGARHMVSRQTPGMTSLKYSILGDMIYFKVLGQPFLVLNSLKRTNDLFEKRSSNYSDRMNSTMVLDL